MPRGVAVSLFFCALIAKKTTPQRDFPIHIRLSIVASIAKGECVRSSLADFGDGKTLPPRNGWIEMVDQQCEGCRYFSPARTCIEKPTWGHCTWATGTDADQGRMEGLFTWADDTCPHFVRRRQSLLRR